MPSSRSSGLRRRTYTGNDLRLNGNIEVKPDSTDDQGGLYDRPADWVQFAEVYYGSEDRATTQIVGDQVISITRHIVLIRSLPGVKGGMRLNGEAGIWKIQSVANADDTGQFMLLTCIDSEAN